jgi:hypothetical protein
MAKNRKGCTDIMNILDIIKKSVEITGHQPFLFIGSGLSKRYLNTENWEDLLRKFCTEFSNNEFQYDIYANQINEEDYYGRQPAIANLLEKDYNANILKSDRYIDFRENYKSDIRNGVSSLKISISEYLSQIEVPNNEEIKLLKQIGKRSISGIITTNYDKMLEILFPQYKTYVGQEELLFSNISGIGEIYKIHGCISQPNSIILTANDYKKFEEKSAYLIAKLLTIFLEYPIIFMGYSLNDRNIKNIFETISKCLPQDKIDILRDRLIFVEFANKEEISSYSISYNNGKKINMQCIRTDDFMAIYKAISSINSKYSPVLLQQLRKDIYELANSSNPNEKIIATGFENLERLEEAKQFVLGVGVARVGHIVKAEEIYEDIVFDNKYFDHNLVLKEYLPELLKSNAGGLPMYKYLRGYDGDIFERVKKCQIKYQEIDSFLNDLLRKSKLTYRRNTENLSVDYIIKNEGFEFAYKKLLYLDADEFDIDKVERYLKTLLKDNVALLKNNSELKRLIRIYDFLKYKNTPVQINQ